MIFQNKTLIGASTLAFFVLSSKNIIIYNEEILVALSFLCFVIFSFSSFQESIKQTFEDRQHTIQQELEQMLVAKEQTIAHLQEQLSTKFTIVDKLQQLKTVSVQELENAQTLRLQAFEASVQKKCVQKLQTLLSLEKQFQHEMHNKIQRSFQKSVLEYFQKNAATLSAQLFDTSLYSIKKIILAHTGQETINSLRRYKT